MEPFLVLLNRWICILQPFEDLRKGGSPDHKSISSKYISLPPQLVFFRALRAKHVLLAALSVTAILANVLTVSLSGLFFIDDATRNQTMLLRPSLEPDFQPGRVDLWGTERGYSASDLHYLAMSNITAGTSLPPWMTPEYYFLPVDLFSMSPRDSGLTRYNVDTFGFGVDPRCRELTQSSSNNNFEFKISRDATRATFFTTHTLADGSIVRCISNNTVSDPTLTDPEVSLGGLVYGKQALELVTSMTNMTSQESDPQYCSNLFVTGWVRADIAWSNKYFETPYGQLMNSTSLSTNMTFMAFQPKLLTGRFNVDVDSSGNVLKASRNGPASPGTGGDLNSVITLTSYSMDMGNEMGPIWHNDTFAIDWTNYLMKGLIKSDALLDAHLPVPEICHRCQCTERHLQTHIRDPPQPKVEGLYSFVKRHQQYPRDCVSE
jgi:hypothetical protein